MVRPRLAALLVVMTAGGGAGGACSSFSAGDPAALVEGGADAAETDGSAADAGADAVGDRTTPSAYRDAILAAGPLAYWRMGKTAGLSIDDESGHGNNLVLQGMAGGYVVGEPGAIVGDTDTAIRFDGKTGNARAAMSRAFDFPDGAPFTIELWAKRDEIEGGAYFQHLISHIEGVATNRTGFLLYVLPTASTPSAYPSTSFEVDALANLEQSTSLGSPVAAGKWGHYAGVVDTAGMLTLYVDANTSTPRQRKGPMTVKTAALVIGAGENGGQFPGTIDEVAIYARALTLTEIAAHKSLGRP
jgi:hypothetical protein